MKNEDGEEVNHVQIQNQRSKQMEHQGFMRCEHAWGIEERAMWLYLIGDEVREVRLESEEQIQKKNESEKDDG